MTAHVVPRTTEQATVMLERYAVIDDDIAGITKLRDAAIAEANAVADKALEPLLKEQTTIAEKLQPWWKRLGHKLLAKDRKSMELGGCTLGTVKAPDSLGHPEDPKPVVAALFKLKWARAKSLIKVTMSLDKAAILKMVDDKVRGDELKELGLTRKAGEDAFFVKRAKQRGAQA